MSNRRFATVRGAAEDPSLSPPSRRSREPAPPAWTAVFAAPTETDSSIPPHSSSPSPSIVPTQELSMASAALQPLPAAAPSASFEQIVARAKRQAVHINAFTLLKDYVFIGTSKGTVIRWDLRSGAKAGDPLDPTTSSDASSSSTTLLPNQMFPLPTQRSEIRPFNLPQLAVEVTSIDVFISIIDVTHDASHIPSFTAEFDNARLRNSPNLVPQRFSPHQPIPINRRCRRLVCGYDDGSLRYWDYSKRTWVLLARGNQSLRKQPSRTIDSQITDKDDDDYDDDDSTTTHSAEDGSHCGAVTAICIPSTSDWDSRIYTGGSDGMFHLWDLSQSIRKPLWKLQAHAIDSTISAISLASCAFNCILKFNSTDIKLERRINPFPKDKEDSSMVRIAPGESVLVTTGTDRTTRLWIPTSGTCVSVFNHPDYEVLSMSSASITRTTIMTIDETNRDSFNNVLTTFVPWAKDKLSKRRHKEDKSSNSTASSSPQSSPSKSPSTPLKHRGREYVELEAVSTRLDSETTTTIKDNNAIPVIITDEYVLGKTTIELTLSVMVLGCSDGIIRMLDLHTGSIIHSFELPKRVKLADGRVDTVDRINMENSGKPRYKSGFGTMKGDYESNFGAKKAKGSRGAVTTVGVSPVSDKIFTGDTFGCVYEWDVAPVLCIARAGLVSRICNVCKGRFLFSNHASYYELERERRQLFAHLENDNLQGGKSLCNCACFLPLIPPTSQTPGKIFEPHATPVVSLVVNIMEHKSNSKTDIEDFSSVNARTGADLLKSAMKKPNSPSGSFTGFMNGDLSGESRFSTFRQRKKYEDDNMSKRSTGVTFGSNDVVFADNKILRPVDIRANVKSALKSAANVMETVTEMGDNATSTTVNAIPTSIRIVSGSTDGEINFWQLDEVRYSVDDSTTKKKALTENVSKEFKLTQYEDMVRNFDLPTLSSSQRSSPKSLAKSETNGLKALSEMRSMIRDNLGGSADESDASKLDSSSDTEERQKHGILSLDESHSISDKKQPEISFTDPPVFNYTRQPPRQEQQPIQRRRSNDTGLFSMLPSAFLRRVGKFLDPDALSSDEEDDVRSPSGWFSSQQPNTLYDNSREYRTPSRHSTYSDGVDSNYLPFSSPSNPLKDPAVKFLTKEVSRINLDAAKLLQSLETVRHDGLFDKMVRDTEASFASIRSEIDVVSLSGYSNGTTTASGDHNQLCLASTRCWEADSEWDSDSDGQIVDDHGLHVNSSLDDTTKNNVGYESTMTFDELSLQGRTNSVVVSSAGRRSPTLIVDTNMKGPVSLPNNSPLNTGFPQTPWWTEFVAEDEKAFEVQQEREQRNATTIQEILEAKRIQRRAERGKDPEQLFSPMTPSSSNRSLYVVAEENEE